MAGWKDERRAVGRAGMTRCERGIEDGHGVCAVQCSRLGCLFSQKTQGGERQQGATLIAGARADPQTRPCGASPRSPLPSPLSPLSAPLSPGGCKLSVCAPYSLQVPASPSRPPLPTGTGRCFKSWTGRMPTLLPALLGSEPGTGQMLRGRQPLRPAAWPATQQTLLDEPPCPGDPASTLSHKQPLANVPMASSPRASPLPPWSLLTPSVQGSSSLFPGVVPPEAAPATPGRGSPLREPERRGLEGP